MNGAANEGQKERLYLFDTTLRDGAQTNGVDFSVEDKAIIAGMLDELGIDYIEGGYPGANPTDSQFFGKPPALKNARFTAFGMTKRAGRSASNDPGFATVANANCDAVCMVAKSWDFHVRVALGISNEENLDSIRESVRAVAETGREPMIDCEHFFDGYKANPEYALACVKAAHEAGARWIVLCDTNGGSMPDEIERIVSEVVKHVPGDRLGIHTHNDTENAVANTLAAVRAGVRQIQGTLNGLGERCGNANLTSLIPTLLLKEPYKSRFETAITDEGLTRLTPVSHQLAELLNQAPNRHAPYVGEAAFAHKGGIHVSAVEKDPSTYEHVPPEAVGNRRHTLVSDQAGRSNILAELRRLGINHGNDPDFVPHLLDEIKNREASGYAYEGADASFVILARRLLGQVPKFFDVKSFRVMVERRFNALGQTVTVSEATVKVAVDGQTVMSVGEGVGPVHALDIALRKDLGGEALRVGEVAHRVLDRPPLGGCLLGPLAIAQRLEELVELLLLGDQVREDLPHREDSTVPPDAR
jgi:2-isopropylmalate synthase